MYSLVLLYIHVYTCMYSSIAEYIAVYHDSLRKPYGWTKPDKWIHAGICLYERGLIGTRLGGLRTSTKPESRTAMYHSMVPNHGK